MFTLSRTGLVQAGLLLLALHLPFSLAIAQNVDSESRANPPRWEVVAKQNIRFRGLIRRIKLKEPSQRVLGLKIRTRGRRMTFSSIKVRFQDGKTHHARRRIRLQSGEVSGPFAMSEKGRLVDEVILIPDVSAPRRRTIRVEILAQLAPKPIEPVSVTGDAKEVSQQQAVTAADIPPANQAVSQESGSPNRKAADARHPGLEPSNGIPKAKPAKKPRALAKPTEKQIIKDVSTAPVNRLAATSTDVDLPSPRPKADNKTEETRPPKISLGVATDGGELLMALGTVSQQDASTSFSVQTRPSRFERIRLHLAVQNLRVEKVVVHYGDGSRQKEVFDVILQRNTHSRWIAVDPKLAIDKVAIDLEASERGKGVARVEVLGQPVLDALLPAAAPKIIGDGWRLIAAQSGRVIKSFDGRIPVARNRGGFSKLRLTRIGRLPRPSMMALQLSNVDGEAVELSISKSDTIELTQAQRGPVERVHLRLPRRAVTRVSNTGIYQIWAKY